MDGGACRGAVQGIDVQGAGAPGAVRAEPSSGIYGHALVVTYLRV